MARVGRRTAVVERRYIGGSCPNINCMPSKNEIWSAKVYASRAPCRAVRYEHHRFSHGRGRPRWRHQIVIL